MFMQVTDNVDVRNYSMKVKDTWLLLYPHAGLPCGCHMAAVVSPC